MDEQRADQHAHEWRRRRRAGPAGDREGVAQARNGRPPAGVHPRQLPEARSDSAAEGGGRGAQLPHQRPGARRRHGGEAVGSGAGRQRHGGEEHGAGCKTSMQLIQ